MKENAAEFFPRPSLFPVSENTVQEVLTELSIDYVTMLYEEEVFLSDQPLLYRDVELEHSIIAEEHPRRDAADFIAGCLIMHRIIRLQAARERQRVPRVTEPVRIAYEAERARTGYSVEYSMATPTTFMKFMKEEPNIFSLLLLLHEDALLLSELEQTEMPDAWNSYLPSDFMQFLSGAMYMYRYTTLAAIADEIAWSAKMN